VAPQLGEVFLQTDEHSSLFLDSQLASLVRRAEQNPALIDGSCFVPRLRQVLGRHAQPEAAHRQRMGFLNLHESTALEAEYFSYRQSALKKAIHQALWVETRRLQKDQYLRNVTGAMAAGLAATWALAAQLPLALQHVSGGLKTAVFALPVIAYVAKDRIKELTREFLLRRLQDYDHLIELTAAGLGDAGLGNIHGELRERLKFLAPDEVPGAVIATRMTRRTLGATETAGESVLHFRRTLALTASAGDTPQFGLRQIIRLNLRHFLTRMDDPEQRVRHFVPELGQFVERALPKVYHLNLVLRVEGAELDKMRWRVVLNKNGIVRIDEVRAT
jgi:hypothetical protein